MSPHGTDAYLDVTGLPPLVARAVSAARQAGFGNSCLPAHGRLLQLLAGGVGAGAIGETGTGCGVGLAWLASGARPGVRLVSVEQDGRRAGLARSVFADVPAVTVLHGDWRELQASGPFELLAMDGGGQGKHAGDPALGPRAWLAPGGTLVLDDFTPVAGWPPMRDGRPDTARLHWLQHPDLLATQIRTQPDACSIVAALAG
jgi:predicted O-methyltransferase YrrM